MKDFVVLRQEVIVFYSELCRSSFYLQQQLRLRYHGSLQCSLNFISCKHEICLDVNSQMALDSSVF